MTENFDAELQTPPAPAAEQIDDLRHRCAAANIAIEERQMLDGSSYLAVLLPNGRNKRPYSVRTATHARELLAVPFERLAFLGPYAAYVDRDSRQIEAELRTLGPLSMPVRDRLFGWRHRGEEGDTGHIKLSSDTGPLTIEIGAPSELLNLAGGRFGRRDMAIRISNVSSTQHDAALDLLERAANSVFFQIDLLFGSPLSLVRVGPRFRRLGTRRRGGIDELRYPTHEYDAEPMALYWYARSARGMPLLQFLAFYQSLEFYFPIYSQVEAQRRVRNVLKDPAFNPARDADLGRLIAASGNAGARGFGDERSQLKATLQETLDPAALLEVLTKDEPRRTFFASKSKALGLDALPVTRETDLRQAVAYRIYDIRCKIVHTKSGGDGEVELLLPFSEGAEALDYDIELIQYVAQQVLIAGSRENRFA